MAGHQLLLRRAPTHAGGPPSIRRSRDGRVRGGPTIGTSRPARTPGQGASHTSLRNTTTSGTPSSFRTCAARSPRPTARAPRRRGQRASPRGCPLHEAGTGHCANTLLRSASTLLQHRSRQPTQRLHRERLTERHTIAHQAIRNRRDRRSLPEDPTRVGSLLTGQHHHDVGTRRHRQILAEPAPGQTLSSVRVTAPMTTCQVDAASNGG